MPSLPFVLLHSAQHSDFWLSTNRKAQVGMFNVQHYPVKCQVTLQNNKHCITWVARFLSGLRTFDGSCEAKGWM